MNKAKTGMVTLAKLMDTWHAFQPPPLFLRTSRSYLARPVLQSSLNHLDPTSQSVLHMAQPLYLVASFLKAVSFLQLSAQ